MIQNEIQAHDDDDRAEQTLPDIVEDTTELVVDRTLIDIQRNRKQTKRVEKPFLRILMNLPIDMNQQEDQRNQTEVLTEVSREGIDRR